jgi:hypothetical protein
VMSRRREGKRRGAKCDREQLTVCASLTCLPSLSVCVIILCTENGTTYAFDSVIICYVMLCHVMLCCE